MKLKELIENHSQRPKTSAPDWLLGCFRRYSISFANGTSDVKTNVFWLQSRNFTIDIRLPIESEQIVAKSLAEYTNDELQRLSNYEGFSAITDWDSEMLSWREADAALQIHNRWTEPAILKRVGNCMVEFCPSNAYVEDWRLQPSKPGPLIGLHLLEERELTSGIVRHKGGGLIICGDYAGLVLGRAEQIIKPSAEATLKTMVEAASEDKEFLSKLFNFETSIAEGSLEQGFSVTMSTQANRLGQKISPLDGFESPSAYHHETLGDIEIVRQKLMVEGKPCERLFSIDTIEAEVNFSIDTAIDPETAAWFARESPTLMRYTEVLD